MTQEYKWIWSLASAFLIIELQQFSVELLSAKEIVPVKVAFWDELILQWQSGGGNLCYNLFMFHFFGCFDEPSIFFRLLLIVSEQDHRNSVYCRNSSSYCVSLLPIVESWLSVTYAPRHKLNIIGWNTLLLTLFRIVMITCMTTLLPGRLLTSLTFFGF